MTIQSQLPNTILNPAHTVISMCLVWTVKYNICGCICERESIYCTPYQFCWGPRAIIFHSNLQTCEDCWQKGDKRVNEKLAKILDRLADEEQQRNRRRDDQTRSKHQTGEEEEEGRTTTAHENSQGGGRRQDSKSTQTKREDADFNEEQDFQTKSDGVEYNESYRDSRAVGRNEDHGIRSPKPSRPNTPVRALDPDLDPDYIPPWLLCIEQNCDLTRVCDPVRVSSISRNYRAPRRRTDWYALEDVLGLYLGPGAERVLDDEQIMEGFIRICEEAGISSDFLEAWIELEKAAM